MHQIKKWFRQFKECPIQETELYTESSCYILTSVRLKYQL